MQIMYKLYCYPQGKSKPNYPNEFVATETDRWLIRSLARHYGGVWGVDDWGMQAVAYNDEGKFIGSTRHIPITLGSIR